MACGDPPLGWPVVQNVVCPCNTLSDFPQACGIHGRAGWLYPPTPIGAPMGVIDYGQHTAPGDPSCLSDGDVERIARRVAEILRESKAAK